MSISNQLICISKKPKNTGFGNCTVDIGTMRGIIYVPKGTVLTTASMAAFKAALAALIINDSYLLRGYPVHGFVGSTDSSEDLTIQTFPYGGKAVVKEGDYDWVFQFTDGRFCLNIALRGLNSVDQDFFIYDSNAKLYGTDPGDGSDSIKAISPTLKWTAPFKLNDGSAVTVYGTRVSFSPGQINENVKFVDLSGSNGGLAYLKSLKGLQDIALSKISRAANVLKIATTTSCGSIDLSGASYYQTQLASASLWRASAPNGNDLTITSVAYDANVHGFTVTIDATDPDYTAGQIITVTLAPVSVLTAAGIIGFEGGSVDVSI